MARIARISIGITLLIAGAVMLVLPGPGILTILAGLALLARDLAWAARLEGHLKRRWAAMIGKTDDAKPAEPQTGG